MTIFINGPNPQHDSLSTCCAPVSNLIRKINPNPNTYSYCTVSGEAPQVPVASSKSGTVFEKRLIEAYIAEHGKDPVTGEELTTDDLIELKSMFIIGTSC